MIGINQTHCVSQQATELMTQHTPFMAAPAVKSVLCSQQSQCQQLNLNMKTDQHLVFQKKMLVFTMQHFWLFEKALSDVYVSDILRSKIRYSSYQFKAYTHFKYFGLKEVFQLLTLTDSLAPYMQFSCFPHIWCQVISYNSFLMGKEGCQSADYFKRTVDSYVSSNRTTKQSFRFRITLKAKICLRRAISFYTGKSTVPSATAWFDRYVTE